MGKDTGDGVTSSSESQADHDNGSGVEDLQTAESPVFLNKDSDISMFGYIMSELSRGYRPAENEANYNVKRERVYTFAKIPFECEKFMMYGFLQCVDAFLFIFTFLPLRFLIILPSLFRQPWALCTSRRVLTSAQKCDVTKVLIVAIVSFILNYYIDVSMIYHLVRGQAIIKLYIFFNMLEVADRLFSSFGQDILDSLMWTVADHKSTNPGLLLIHLVLAVLYVFLHAFLVLLQATCLNVAFNSHNKALLTIMMSNNFVELKGSVFKKFEKSNLFQMACSDVRERFHTTILLFIVFIRNMSDLNWDIARFMDLIPDIVFMLCCEVLVDAVKHAFITKFNNIPSNVYKEYSVMLADDMITGRQKNAFSDVSDQVSRRMGFIPLPLACLLIRIVTQCVKVESATALLNTVLAFLCLATLKIAVSIVILGWAVNYRSSYVRRATKDKASPFRSDSLANLSAYSTVKLTDIGFDEDLLRCENNYHLKSPRFTNSEQLTRETTKKGETTSICSALL